MAGRARVANSLLDRSRELACTILTPARSAEIKPVAKETHFDRAVIGDILARVHPVAGRAFVVAIDGPGGSGKSTLARELAAAYDGLAAVVEGDDFYADLDDGYRVGLDAQGGYREYFDWQRVRDQVFVPARQGRPLSYQRYDWDNARMGDWVTVPGVELLLVEGVYSGRPELREYSDLVVWVTTSEQERVRRQLERAQNQGIWIKRWMAAENYYLEHIHHPGWAEIVLGE
jgi:uridine kinase